MDNENLTLIRDKLTQQHEGDIKQLEVIFSDSQRLVVEAPAGYGKTTTMISRIAYLFASERISNPKKILGLTFSVNAALKVKREVAEKLPSLIESNSNPLRINERATITNYHGFCKGVLNKYGYLLTDSLRINTNQLRGVGDSDISKTNDLKTTLTTDELSKLENLEATVKNARMPNMPEIHEYNNIVIRKLIPVQYITHNAVILLVIQLFNTYEEVRRFYQQYYPLIVVDEFQDTNCIAWSLLKSLITENTQLVFLGDSLQRIYGFIGALPNIMKLATDEYSLTFIALQKNYRFRNNLEMLGLDRNIRANAEYCFAPPITEKDISKLPAFWGNMQQEESSQIVSKIHELISSQHYKVAILFWRRGDSTDITEMELNNLNIPYFYGMFADEDADYVDFHFKCLNLFVKKFGKSNNVTKKGLLAFVENVKGSYANTNERTTLSLLRLLDALVEKVSIDYVDLSPEDKYELILEIFENRQLKQAMEYVDTQVILSTIHGAKGLEWDYVFLVDVEQWVSTFSCFDCTSKTKSDTSKICELPTTIPRQMVDKLLNDLCVFYVGLTRARKQAYVSASCERFNTSGKQFMSGKFCCFAKLQGVKLVNAKTFETS